MTETPMIVERTSQLGQRELHCNGWHVDTQLPSYAELYVNTTRCADPFAYRKKLAADPGLWKIMVLRSPRLLAQVPKAHTSQDMLDYVACVEGPAAMIECTSGKATEEERLSACARSLEYNRGKTSYRSTLLAVTPRNVRYAGSGHTLLVMDGSGGEALPEHVLKQVPMRAVCELIRRTTHIRTDADVLLQLILMDLNNGYTRDRELDSAIGFESGGTDDTEAAVREAVAVMLRRPEQSRSWLARPHLLDEGVRQWLAESCVVRHDLVGLMPASVTAALPEECSSLHAL